MRAQTAFRLSVMATIPCTPTLPHVVRLKRNVMKRQKHPADTRRTPAPVVKIATGETEDATETTNPAEVEEGLPAPVCPRAASTTEVRRTVPQLEALEARGDAVRARVVST